MLKNSNGQALVEFVIIIPIFMMILFIIIDFANIFYQKNHLEDVAHEVVVYKESNKSDEYINNKLEKNITYKTSNKGDTIVITLSEKVKLVTPFSDVFFDNPYTITTQRTIINE